MRVLTCRELGPPSLGFCVLVLFKSLNFLYGRNVGNLEDIYDLKERKMDRRGPDTWRRPVGVWVSLSAIFLALRTRVTLRPSHHPS